MNQVVKTSADTDGNAVQTWTLWECSCSGGGSLSSESGWQEDGPTLQFYPRCETHMDLNKWFSLHITEINLYAPFWIMFTRWFIYKDCRCQRMRV